MWQLKPFPEPLINQVASILNVKVLYSSINVSERWFRFLYDDIVYEDCFMASRYHTYVRGNGTDEQDIRKSWDIESKYPSSRLAIFICRKGFLQEQLSMDDYYGVAIVDPGDSCQFRLTDLYVREKQRYSKRLGTFLLSAAAALLARHGIQYMSLSSVSESRNFYSKVGAERYDSDPNHFRVETQKWTHYLNKVINDPCIFN